MLKNLYNLRPYSWIDLFLIGFVAKFAITKTLLFETKDILMILGLFSLWTFFNLALEIRHGYPYRAKPKLFWLGISTLSSILIGIYFNPLSIIFAILSIILVLLYLFKNKNVIFGNLGIFFRGLIQITYFFYALMIYTNEINTNCLIIGTVIFLIYSTRSVIGDMRDIKHNKEAKKKTFVVNYGLKSSTILVESLLILSILLIILFYNILVTIPLLLFCLIIIFFRNGYILHQLMIFTTSFLSINLITKLTNNNLFFINLIFLSIFLNLIFYPLLKRKSNPEFNQPNEFFPIWRH